MNRYIREEIQQPKVLKNHDLKKMKFGYLIVDMPQITYHALATLTFKHKRRTQNQIQNTGTGGGQIQNKEEEKKNEVNDSGDDEVTHLEGDEEEKVGEKRKDISKTFNLDLERPLINEFINEILKLLTRIVKSINPTKYIILAFDGICPVSRLHYNLRDKYKSEYIKEGPQNFEGYMAYGTEFSARLLQKIQDYLYYNTSVNYVLDSGKYPNEGDWKVMKYLHENDFKGEYVAVVSQDTDILVSALTSNNINIFTMFPSKGGWNLNNIDGIREKILKSIKVPDLIDVLKLDFLRNFHMLEILVDNAHVPAMFDRKRSSELVKDFFRFFDQTGKPLINGKTILWDNLRTFLKYKVPGKGRHYNENEIPISKLAEQITMTQLKNLAPNLNLDDILKECSLYDICKSVFYLFGLKYSLLSALDEPPSWTWAYPYPSSPRPKTLLKIWEYIGDIDDKKVTFEKGEPFYSIFKKHVFTINKEKIYLLPEPIRGFWKLESSLAYFETVENDLPTINPETLIEFEKMFDPFFKQIVSKLSPAEIERSKIVPNMSFIITNDKAAKLAGGNSSRPLTKQEQEQQLFEIMYKDRLFKQIDDRNTMELFEGFIKEVSQQTLKREQAYIEYAKRVGEILMKEDGKKHIQEFIKEILNVVYPKFTSLEYQVGNFQVCKPSQEIHTKATILFNQKQKEEKSVDSKKKKGGKQPTLNEKKATGKLTDLKNMLKTMTKRIQPIKAKGHHNSELQIEIENIFKYHL